ncbi:ammonium transporter AmtB-like domain-containing protein [Cadophora sp. MPI-SDFR-AT-0126]|nr:ammonium transporter AmtB-like domain-containing protein [Leotiomycetes sp. MPI-SDFR-AT-0126]
MESATLNVAEPVQTLVEVSVAYDEILAHPERYFQGSDIVWMMVSSALVFLMIPALSLIYAGMGNRSYALTLFRLPLMTAGFIGFQWALWGYAFTFTRSSVNWWGGERRAFGLTDVIAHPIDIGDDGEGGSIPELVYVLYEGMFAAFTAALVCGGTMHRAPPTRFLGFITLWSVLIYYPVARWSWDSDGWSNKLGIMDFAGGTPVHIVSGTTVAAFAVFCGFEERRMSGEVLIAVERLFENFQKRLYKRLINPWVEQWKTLRSLVRYCSVRYFGKTPRPLEDDESDSDSSDDGEQEVEPYSVNYVVLGTALLWFGWSGFNGGSALGGNLRAVSAWTSTHIAASSGGAVGVLLIWRRKMFARAADPGQDMSYDNLTALYFCDGAIAGLVAITPGAGFVPVWSAAIFGVISSLVVYLLKEEALIFLKRDPLQIFAVHTGGGIVGMCLTGLFASEATIGLDGHSTIPYPDRTRGERLGYQIADSVAGISYTFVVTLAILYFEKLVVFVFMNIGKPLRDWKPVPGVTNTYRDHLQATPMQTWRAAHDDVPLQTIDHPQHPGPLLGPVEDAPIVNGNTPHHQTGLVV